MKRQRIQVEGGDGTGTGGDGRGGIAESAPAGFPSLQLGTLTVDTVAMCEYQGSCAGCVYTWRRPYYLAMLVRTATIHDLCESTALSKSFGGKLECFLPSAASGDKHQSSG